MSGYLLDTTVLIAHLRGDAGVSQLLLDLLSDGHRLGICCINVAEVERGLRPAERKKAKVLIDRLEYFDTTGKRRDEQAGTRRTFSAGGGRYMRPTPSLPGRRGRMGRCLSPTT